tara:strand:+ start:479 stop:784 length:306 start_codon:yes stop_codon:yes gene_type:complete
MKLSTQVIETARLTKFQVSWHGCYNAEPRTNTLDEIIGEASPFFADRDAGFNLEEEFLWELCDLDIGEQAVFSDLSGDVKFTKLTYGQNLALVNLLIDGND